MRLLMRKIPLNIGIIWVHIYRSIVTILWLDIIVPPQILDHNIKKKLAFQNGWLIIILQDW